MQEIYGVYRKVGGKTVLRSGVLTETHSLHHRTASHSNLFAHELLKRYPRNAVSHSHTFHTYNLVSLVYFQQSNTYSRGTFDYVSPIKYKSHITLKKLKQGTFVIMCTSNNNEIAWFAGSYTKGTK